MRRAGSLIALAVALVVGGVLLASRPTTRPAVPAKNPAAPRTVSVRPSTIGPRLADGARFTPVFYADADTAVGTAQAPDGSAERLVLRSSGTERELRRIPLSNYPQFLGFTAADGVLYWAESTAVADGRFETRLWRAPLGDAVPPVSLTADTGTAVFYESQFDLVVAEGRLHWVAAAPEDAPRTELRSVPLGGGPVSVEDFPGRYRWTTWPWLQSVSQQDGPVQLVNRATGERRTVSATAAETVECTPAWCRSVVQTAGGRNLFDVLRPDGSQRRRIPGEINAITVDVGLLDRFELVTGLDGTDLRLLAFDLRTGELLVLAQDVGLAVAHGNMVWWSSGPQDPDAWSALDLRTIA